MKLDELTQEQVDKLTAKLKEADEIKQKYDKLVDDVGVLTNVGADPEKHQGAMGRLLQSTGLYSDEQIAEMVKRSTETREEEVVDPEELIRDLNDEENTNVEYDRLQARMDELDKTQRATAISALAKHIDSQVASVTRPEIINVLKEISKEKGIPFEEPSASTVDFWVRDINSRVKSEVMKFGKNTNSIPTAEQTDGIIKQLLPTRVKEFRSVMADPAMMRKVETVSGSKEGFDLPEEPVQPPKMEDIITNKISRNEAQIHQDAARVDQLSRLAVSSAPSGDTEV